MFLLDSSALALPVDRPNLSRFRPVSERGTLQPSSSLRSSAGVFASPLVKSRSARPSSRFIYLHVHFCLGLRASYCSLRSPQLSPWGNLFCSVTKLILSINSLGVWLRRSPVRLMVYIINQKLFIAISILCKYLARITYHFRFIFW